MVIKKELQSVQIPISAIKTTTSLHVVLCFKKSHDLNKRAAGPMSDKKISGAQNLKYRSLTGIIKNSGRCF